MRPIFATLFLTACISHAGPLQLRWTAELSDPKPYNAVLFAYFTE